MTRTERCGYCGCPHSAHNASGCYECAKPGHATCSRFVDPSLVPTAEIRNEKRRLYYALDHGEWDGGGSPREGTYERIADLNSELARRRAFARARKGGRDG